ncbi:MAG: hypothetical protein LBH98_06335 [Chitinispirillales bacterium]|jgi:heptosyltransferase-2|nr:hypothetical protein [Chitinispirillales bacterium]
MPKRIQLSELEFTKILTIRFDKSDEVMQTLPAIRVLKRQYPQAEIHFAVKKEYADILTKVKEISKIHILDKDEKFPLTTLHDALSKEFFDLLVDLQCDFRSSYLYSCSPGAKKLFCKKYHIQKLLLFFKKNAEKTFPPLWQCFLDVLPKQDYEVSQTDFEIVNEKQN